MIFVKTEIDYKNKAIIFHSIIFESLDNDSCNKMIELYKQGYKLIKQ